MFRQLSIAVLIACFFNLSLGYQPLLAYEEGFALPQAGRIVPLSPKFDGPILKGLKVHADNPFRFDFILDKGDSPSLLQKEDSFELKQEAAKLIKYFLASLTIPEKDLWVTY